MCTTARPSIRPSPPWAPRLRWPAATSRRRRERVLPLRCCRTSARLRRSASSVGTTWRCGHARSPASRRPNRPTSTAMSKCPYSRLLSPEQRGEFGDTLNSTTVLPNALNAMLAALDANRVSPAAGTPPIPRRSWRSGPSRLPRAPTACRRSLMSTTYDPAVSASQTGWLRDELQASANKGRCLVRKVVTYYTVPPADGWTQFDAGAKGPNAVASSLRWVAAEWGTASSRRVGSQARTCPGSIGWSKTGRPTSGAINRQMWAGGRGQR